MGIWETTAQESLRAAKLLHLGGAHRAAASRAYYAAYQAATGLCIAHGDAVHFPVGMNNPSHNQLTGLVENNRTLTVVERREIIRSLRYLRIHREIADYKPGQTIGMEISRQCLQDASYILQQLGIETDE